MMPRTSWETWMQMRWHTRQYWTFDRSRLSELPEGQRVRMQISQGQKGPEARSIEILD